MLAELKTTASSNKIQSFYTKEEEYDLVYITVILLAVLLDSGTCRDTTAIFSEEGGAGCLIFPPYPPPPGGGPSTISAGGKTAFLSFRYWCCQKVFIRQEL